MWCYGQLHFMTTNPTKQIINITCKLRPTMCFFDLKRGNGKQPTCRLSGILLTTQQCSMKFKKQTSQHFIHFHFMLENFAPCL